MPQNGNREYNIDLLKIISMILMIYLHIVNRNCYVDLYSSNFVTVTTRILCASSVSVYSIISGYLSCFSKHRVSNLVNHYLSVVFYSLPLYVIHHMVTLQALTLKEIAIQLLPVCNDIYWFFTIYAIGILISPVMNWLLRRISKNVSIILIVAGITLTSAIGICTPEKYAVMNAICNRILFIIMFYLGMCIRYYNINPKAKNKSLILYVLCILLTFLFAINFESVVSSFFNRAESSCFIYTANYFPLNIIASVLLFNIFRLIKLEFGLSISDRVNKSNFEVYIIHEHPYFGSFLLIRYITWINNFGLSVKPIIIIFVSCLIYFVCCLIDQVRIHIFSKCELTNRLENKFKDIDALYSILQRNGRQYKSIL